MTEFIFNISFLRQVKNPPSSMTGYHYPESRALSGLNIQPYRREIGSLWIRMKIIIIFIQQVIDAK